MLRLDAHQHFWTYDPERYGWIGEGMDALARDFGPEDLRPHLEAGRLDGSIVVQARQDPDETRELLALARTHDFLKGVVGWVDLEADDLGERLDELAAHPELRGIRHVLQDEPDDAHMLRPAFRRGIGHLAAHGLTYDLLLHPRHLPVSLTLVDEFPDQPFVLDHLAKPFIARGELEPWAGDLRELARRPHVTCKISGLVTEARWDAWTPADLRPYLDTALEAFGPGRLMFGSDWPVCLLAGEHARVREVVEGWAAPLSEDERAALMGGNAARVYGVEA